MWTLQQLSQRVKQAVEGVAEFRDIRIDGEVIKPFQAASGHLYFSLKDADAVLDGICWRGTAGRLGLNPEDGMEVVATGRLTTYPGRSKYQIVVEGMELAGEGALLKLLEERKRKLAQEGLFNEERKQPLPFLPDVIGVITSPTGAVIRDILHRLNDRFPRRVLLWPVLVQGAAAAGEIALAVEGFNRLPAVGPVPRPDLLIVARGGGSLEDLWPFNDEAVVRAAVSGYGGVDVLCNNVGIQPADSYLPAEGSPSHRSFTVRSSGFRSGAPRLCARHHPRPCAWKTTRHPRRFPPRCWESPGAAARLQHFRPFPGLLSSHARSG